MTTLADDIASAMNSGWVVLTDGPKPKIVVNPKELVQAIPNLSIKSSNAGGMSVEDTQATLYTGTEDFEVLCKVSSETERETKFDAIKRIIKAMTITNGEIIMTRKELFKTPNGVYTIRINGMKISND